MRHLGPQFISKSLEPKPLLMRSMSERSAYCFHHRAAKFAASAQPTLENRFLDTQIVLSLDTQIVLQYPLIVFQFRRCSCKAASPLFRTG